MAPPVRILAVFAGVCVRVFAWSYFALAMVFMSDTGWLVEKHADKDVPPFNYHLLSMSIAFLALTEGVVAYATVEHLLGQRHKVAKRFHGLQFLLATAAIICGLVAIFQNHEALPDKPPPFKSAHSWYAVFSLVIFVVVALFGIVVYGLGLTSPDTRAAMLQFKRVLGMAMYYSFLATMMAGLNEKQSYVANEEGFYARDKMLAAAMGLCLPLTGLAVAFHVVAGHALDKWNRAYEKGYQAIFSANNGPFGYEAYV